MAESPKKWSLAGGNGDQGGRGRVGSTFRYGTLRRYSFHQFDAKNH
jgi:hypothetical protein